MAELVLTMTEARIRDVKPSDLQQVLTLNQSAVPGVTSLQLEELDWFVRHAAYFRVAHSEASVEGFLIALTPEADYSSPNFQWFRPRYSRFVYIDRIVIAEDSRRQGLGQRFYEDLERFSCERVPLLACEVNLRPPNAGSLAFHRRCGFQVVGTQETEGGAKQVALMVRQLHRRE